MLSALVAVEHLTQTLELVRRAQSGESDALNRLLTRYYGRVGAIVRVRIGERLRRKVDTGDILQETFTVAVRNFDRFEMQNEASFVNWLAKLAERQITDAADRIRAQKRDVDREVSLSAPGQGGDDSGRSALDVPSEEPAPFGVAAAAEDRAIVERCLAELDEAQRELILLRDYAGFAWKEIAQQTGRPSADAARMAHSQALVELARGVRRNREDSVG